MTNTIVKFLRFFCLISMLGLIFLHFKTTGSIYNVSNEIALPIMFFGATFLLITIGISTSEKI